MVFYVRNFQLMAMRCVVLPASIRTDHCTDTSSFLYVTGFIQNHVLVKPSRPPLSPRPPPMADSTFSARSNISTVLPWYAQDKAAVKPATPQPKHYSSPVNIVRDCHQQNCHQDIKNVSISSYRLTYDPNIGLFFAHFWMDLFFSFE